MRLTAHQLVAIRRRAPSFRIEVTGPGTRRAALGRAWAVATERANGWQCEGPYQIIRDAETLADTRQLRSILLELGVRGVPAP